MRSLSVLGFGVLTFVSVGVASAQSANVAPLGVASQFDDYVGIGGTAHAWKAIDGFTEPNWFNGFRLSSTSGAPGGWWELALPRAFEITEVILYNRSDCCASRLSNFRVSVHDGATELAGQDFFVGSGFVPAAGMAHFVPPAGTYANRIRIALINGLNNVNNGFLTLAEVQVMTPSVGTTYCSPANNNASGGPASIHVVGTDLLSSQVATGLIARGMPETVFGYFLVGSAQGSATPPGSNGLLCLGGTLGRYSLFVTNTERTDNMGILIDRNAIPVFPVRPIQPGETWRFQAWFRDGASSNFSDAAAVTFH